MAYFLLLERLSIVIVVHVDWQGQLLLAAAEVGLPLDHVILLGFCGFLACA